MAPSHRKSASRDSTETADREATRSRARKASTSRAASKGTTTRSKKSRVSPEPELSDVDSTPSKVFGTLAKGIERRRGRYIEVIEPEGDYLQGYRGFVNCMGFSFMVNLLFLWAMPFWASTEITSVSRRPTREGDPELNALIPILKLFTIATMWILNFDDRDAWNACVATWAPHYLFLYTFKNVSVMTCLVLYLISTLATSLPFTILRPSTPWYPTPPSDPVLPASANSVLNDPRITLVTTLFATAVYSVSLFFFYRNGALTAQIATYFDAISFERAHSKEFQIILPFLLLPVAAAIRAFIFAPAARKGFEPTAAELGDREAFDPATASVWGTFLHTIGPLNPSTIAGKRIASIFLRALYLMSIQMFHAIVETGSTVMGATKYGGAIWGGIWAVATAAIAIGYAFFVTV
ncbi:hypothetical protein P152DRAFT_446202 [Eremomyces bilateralis CBS 781.70]|uniref:Uncharacterized protein n=1 Tax=Eremomyces bilateralis CBS 781.70 TaxID=1392243 RepID=A0A6G1GEY3_9PEZI|nr:uncharacterized protein P152DRAFT_446202 [Eremomyces bilateralis CBS 781.70]KAF1816562.1 hypothetical protein P152DRAFT_446202 [Eremomyces bilateralis CBS 781.70]